MTPASLLLKRYRRAVRLFALAALASIACCCAWAVPAGALPASFGSEGARAGQISGIPGGIAVEQATGDVWVADKGNARVEKFGPEGEFLFAFGWGVADGETEAFQTCTTTCFAGFEGSGAGEFFGSEGGPEGIAVDNDLFGLSHGDVYVVDPRNHRVQKFGPNGEFLLMFGVEGTGPGQFEGLSGRSVAVDSEGVVYVGDRNRVQRFSEAGVPEGQVAFAAIGPVQELALDSAKNIYLRGFFQEVGGVHKYDPVGVELGKPRDEAGFGESLHIAVGPADELFVNDLQATRHILSFDAEGKQTASFGKTERPNLAIAYSEHTEALYVLNPGGVSIVTPPPPGPFILLGSESASQIEPTTATLNAIANPEGPEATKCHFQYGTSTAYDKETAETELSGGPFEDQPIEAPITGLSPSTTYHFRASCENAAKEVGVGPDETFTTLPSVSIDHTSVSQVDATSARLQADLNPHGVQSEYRFEYGPTTAYGTSVPEPNGSVGSGTADTTVENQIQELTPSTTYHYRVIARNALNQPGEFVVGPDHTFTTQGASSILADGRAWEMVSPPNKHGAPLEPLTAAGGLIQSSLNGGAFAYVSDGPVDTEPQDNRSPHDTQLIATRSQGGWSTQDIATPHEEISIVRAGSPSEYKFFAEDLHAGILEPEGITPLSARTTERTPYSRELLGECAEEVKSVPSPCYVALVTAANVPAGIEFGGEESSPGNGTWVHGANFLTATPDLAHLVLESPQALGAGFGPGFEPVGEGRQNLYELSSGKLTLISVLPSGKPTSEEGFDSKLGFEHFSMRGAIANDGGRVVFETPVLHLYLRDMGLGQTLQLDERQPGAAGGAGIPKFAVANSDESKVLFADDAQLTPDATASPTKPDLYMCEVKVSAGHLSCALSDLSVDPNAGEAANVAGTVSAIDASAEHVFFAADGVLTSKANARGEVAVPGRCGASEGASTEEALCNLYEYDTNTRQIGLVAVLSSRDEPDWAQGSGVNLGRLTARSSPDGRYFTFMSRRSLSGYDNRDVHSGQADEEVFQLDTQSGELSCISCNPSGARPNGSFVKENPGPLFDRPHAWANRWLAGSIPGWTQQALGVALYQSRYLSNSGREFFNSSDALVPQDTNKTTDVYEFEPPGVGDCTSSSKTYSSTSAGCVALISSGSSKEESAFLDATESGDEVFFLTDARLLTSDVDTAFDVYDARVCSASSPCSSPPPPPSAACEGDSCQNPSSPLANQTPGSLSYAGPENPLPLSAKLNASSKPKTLIRARRLAVALRSCRVKSRGGRRRVCERRARHRYGVVRAGGSGHDTNRRGK
jgi:hypothetical protein